MKLQRKGKYTLKTYENYLYTWKPDTGVPNSRNRNTGANINNKFCNAKAFSQGEDWFTTYVYEIIVVNNIAKRIAYVECDYVK